MRRGFGLILVLLVVAAAAFGGWLVGQRINTPEEIAVDAEPPEPSLITVPVELRTIATDIITRGTVRFDQPEALFAGEPPQGFSPVVTKITSPGSEVGEGDVLYEVAGRPTFVLQGDIPLFRDLAFGAEGEDVAQLQAALARLGFSPGEFDGVYGVDTQAAVRAFYTSHGYEPVGATELEDDELSMALDEAELARDAHSAAAAGRTEAIHARDALAKAVTTATGTQNAVATAQGRLEEALAGTHPDHGGEPTAAEITTLESELAKAEAADATAQDALASAQSRADLAGPVMSIDTEQDAVDDANARVAAARAAASDKVPTAEIVFFELFPLRVDSVAVARGDLATGEIMQVSGSRLAIDASIDITEADLVEVGDTVTIDLTRLDISLTGVVNRKADRAGTDGVGASDVYLEIIPDEVLEELNNASVRISIPVESTAGDVLVVPLAALTATAGGGSIVTVEDEDGAVRTVEVSPGLSSAGLVEIAPIEGDLAEGDRVVVGQQ